MIHNEQGEAQYLCQPYRFIDVEDFRLVSKVLHDNQGKVKKYRKGMKGCRRLLSRDLVAIRKLKLIITYVLAWSLVTMVRSQCFD
jgi:hypothetical protein